MESRRFAFAAVTAFGLGFAACADVIYVAPDGAGDGSDADHPASLSAAVETAPAGSIVQLADGEYVVPDRLTVRNVITIQGNNSNPEAVILTNRQETAETTGGFFKASDATKFCGLTLTGMKYSGSDRGRCLSGGGNSTIVSNCVIRGNLATSSSAYGICASVSVYDSKFLGNTAVYGGCVFGANLYRCEIVGNTASDGFISASSDSYYDCLIVGNTGQNMVWGRGACYNCTIVANNTGGGSLGNTTLYNCIVFGNRRSNGTLAGPNVNCYRCFVDAGVSADKALDGTVISTDDPGFVDFAGGDYHLRAASKYVDFGNVDYVTREFALDLEPRSYGVAPDIGCYEKTTFAAGELGVGLVCAVDDTEVTATVSLQTGDGDCGYSVDWGDSSAVDSGTKILATGNKGLSFTLSHVYPSRGFFTITVTADKGDSLTMQERFDVVLAFPPNSTFHIDAVNGDDARADGTREHPFKTIRNVMLAQDDCTVCLAPGDYAVESEFVIDRPGMTVVGDVRNPGLVRLFRPAEAETRYRVAHCAASRVTLRGLTIVNGSTLVDGGGALVSFSDCRIENCVFEGCVAANGGGVKSLSADCVIDGCVFTACSAGSGGGLSGDARVLSTTVADCVSTGSAGGAYFGKATFVSNCVFRANRSAQSGPAFVGGPKVFDSVFIRNVGSSGETWNGGIGSITFTRCLFVENGNLTANFFYTRGCDGVYDSLFIGNKFKNSVQKFVNCSFIGNEIASDGVTDGMNLVNCLWMDNKKTDGTLPVPFSPTSVCCAFDSDEYAAVAGDTGSLFLMRSALGVKMAVTAPDDWSLPLATPRYKLAAGSPLATGGDPAVVDTTARPFDLAHNPRVYTKGANIGRVAIGCYQAIGATPLVFIVR